MKRIFTLLFAMAMMFSVTGCSGSSADNTSENTESETTETEETSTTSDYEVSVEDALTLRDDSTGEVLDFADIVLKTVGVCPDEGNHFGDIYLVLNVKNNTDEELTVGSRGLDSTDTVDPNDEKTITLYFGENDIQSSSDYFFISNPGSVKNDEHPYTHINDIDVPAEIMEQHNELLASNSQEQEGSNEESSLNIVICDNEYGKIVIDSFDDDYTAAATFTNNSAAELQPDGNATVGDLPTVQPGGSIQFEVEAPVFSSDDLDIENIASGTYRFMTVSIIDPNQSWEYHDKDESGDNVETGMGKTVYGIYVLINVDTHKIRELTEDEAYMLY